MKPTYTREQLEALRDCSSRGDCVGCILNDSDIACKRPIYFTLAADLLSALDEIERLRTALKPFAEMSEACKHMGGTFPKTGPIYAINYGFDYGAEITREHLIDAHNALKETVNE